MFPLGGAKWKTLVLHLFPIGPLPLASKKTKAYPNLTKRVFESYNYLEKLIHKLKNNHNKDNNYKVEENMNIQYF